MLSYYFKSSLLIRILIGLILGAVVGLMQGSAVDWIKPFGTLFVRLLKMIVIPTIFFSLIVGAASVEPTKLGRVGGKIIGTYLITMAIAVVIGLVLAHFVHLGSSIDFTAGSADAKGLTVHKPSTSEVLLAIIPTNPFGALAKGSVLPIIFFAIVFGIAISILRSSEDKEKRIAGDAVFNVANGGAESMYMIVQWVMQYAPIGVFALILNVFATQGAAVVGGIGQLLAVAYASYIVHTLIIISGMCLLVGLSPKKFFSIARTPMLTAFVTRSSSATLPLTMNAAKTMGISESVYSFSLPLGATVNMNGTAIYIGVAVIFIANACQLDLSIAQQASIVLSAVLGAIGTAGVPGAGSLLLLVALQNLGFDLSGGGAVAAAYAVVLGVDAITDMGRTCVNITGDLGSTLLVARIEDGFDRATWDKAHAM